MYKQTIISAIQSRRMIRVSFKKETTGESVTRDIAPYDIFPQKKKGGFFEEDYLLGFTDLHSPHKAHPASVYLSNISSVDILNESFDGGEIKRILNPKEQPNIPRSW